MVVPGGCWCWWVLAGGVGLTSVGKDARIVRIAARRQRAAAAFHLPLDGNPSLPGVSLPQGETTVNVHGTLNGFTKLASKLCSPSIPYKFDAATAELNSLTKQVGGAWHALTLAAGGAGGAGCVLH